MAPALDSGVRAPLRRRAPMPGRDAIARYAEQPGGRNTRLWPVARGRTDRGHEDVGCQVGGQIGVIDTPDDELLGNTP